MPKHEAQQKLADYIEEYTGKLIHQGESIERFAELWKAFSAVKAGSWGKKMREDMKYLFDKHVLPVLGQCSPRKITLTPLQLLVNKMAEDGYSRSAVKHIRTYLKACFEYAIDEDLIPKNPARKLALPNIHKKPCERFLSVEEVKALLTAASPREHLVAGRVRDWPRSVLVRPSYQYRRRHRHLGPLGRRADCAAYDSPHNR